MKARPLYGANGYDERIEGYQLTKRLSEGQYREAQRWFGEILKPADPSAIGVAITRLRSLTKAKDDMGVGTAYVQELRPYPAWAIEEACQACAGAAVFFPAWSELRGQLEALVSPYRQMADALDKAPVELGGPQKPNPKYHELTPEQRAEFDRTMAEFHQQFGGRS